MEFYHTTCGGRIDVKSRSCLKCRKKWTWVSFKFTLTEIRQVPISLAKKKARVRTIRPGATSYAKWADNLPDGIGGGFTRGMASRLPNWPRWARILVVVVFVGIIIVLLWRFLW